MTVDWCMSRYLEVWLYLLFMFSKSRTVFLADAKEISSETKAQLQEDKHQARRVESKVHRGFQSDHFAAAGYAQPFFSPCNRQTASCTCVDFCSTTRYPFLQAQQMTDLLTTLLFLCYWKKKKKDKKEKHISLLKDDGN